MTPATALFFEGHPACPALFWHYEGPDRAVCEVCPRQCRLAPGQRGLCHVRAHAPGQGLVLTGYGQVAALQVDPVEKKPLYHFLPGTRTLSLGGIGCNLTCRFCQNHDLSRAKRRPGAPIPLAPGDVPTLARRHGCPSVALTYNEPLVSLEYGLDIALACREAGVRTLAVTAGYACDRARSAFLGGLDAANVDLKAFSEDFYRTLCSGHLAPVLDTLVWLRRETAVWLEITTLLVPGKNDGEYSIRALAAWIAETLGPEVPLHFSAFFPAWRMSDAPPTPAATLLRARDLARTEGLAHVYVGNVPDPEGGLTRCAGCGAGLIVRNGYETRLREGCETGLCPGCGRALAGRFV